MTIDEPRYWTDEELTTEPPLMLFENMPQMALYFSRLATEGPL